MYPNYGQQPYPQYPPGNVPYGVTGQPQPQYYPPANAPPYSVTGQPMGQPYGYSAGGHPGVAYNVHSQGVHMQAQQGGHNAGSSWMQRPTPSGSCPPGLEYLAQVDQVLVQQLVEMLEAFTGWETCNKYRVLNNMGQQCYYAFEESDFCMYDD